MSVLTEAPVAFTRAAKFWVLTLELGGEILNAGILLEDAAQDRLYLRLRRDWEEIAPEESEVLCELEDGLRATAAELGATHFLERLEDTLSNTLRISEPESVLAENSIANSAACIGGTCRRRCSNFRLTCRAIPWR